jgi:hypothetical protein
MARERLLTSQLALAQIPSVEQRLHLLLWLLADRWGRRTPNGVLLPLRLSQETLAQLIAARRQSVNAALQRLLSRQAVSRGAGGLVLLAPPTTPASPVIGCRSTGLSGDGQLPSFAVSADGKQAPTRTSHAGASDIGSRASNGSTERSSERQGGRREVG